MLRVAILQLSQDNGYTKYNLKEFSREKLGQISHEIRLAILQDTVKTYCDGKVTAFLTKVDEIENELTEFENGDDFINR